MKIWESIGESRYSFRSVDQYRDFQKRYSAQLTSIWMWHQSLGNQSCELRLKGICNICDTHVDFVATPKPSIQDERFKFSVNYWQDVKCKCDLNGSERAVLRILLEYHHYQNSLYHVGHFSTFAKWLQLNMTSVITSQYVPGKESGSVVNGVRIEDLTCLSFANDTLSAVICLEILEHIYDYKKALFEIWRTLRQGGMAIFTFPWLGRDIYDHRVRAEVSHDGTIFHLLPPEYHGDPASKEGILSYRSFGWQILDDLREAGFSEARAEFILSPLHGFMSIQTPVIVAAK